MQATSESRIKSVENEITIKFAGDSGDGVQLTGSRFASTLVTQGTNVVTLADYPAEIRAPAGSLYGVSGYQLNLGENTILSPGDKVDILVAFNPAALKANLASVKKPGLILVNEDAFSKKNLEIYAVSFKAINLRNCKFITNCAQ